MRKSEVDKNQLMRAAFYHPAAISDAKLSVMQREIIKTIIKRRRMTTARLAEIRGISVFNASQQLTRLSGLGYLDRVEMPDPSGGFFNEYTVDPTLWGAA